MSEPPTWTDVEHEQTDIVVVLSVSEALALKGALPRLLQVLDNGHARTPDDRERQRQAHAAISMLVGRLRDGLRPFDVPPTPEVR
jgi:hypothetical protein